MKSSSLPFIAAIALTLTGCLAYRSDGRKVFESRAPTNINQNFSAALWCWAQTNTDEFWTETKSENLIYTAKDDGTIEVCTPEAAVENFN
jgi:hypothetical protein